MQKQKLGMGMDLIPDIGSAPFHSSLEKTPGSKQQHTKHLNKTRLHECDITSHHISPFMHEFVQKTSVIDKYMYSLKIK